MVIINGSNFTKLLLVINVFDMDKMGPLTHQSLKFKSGTTFGIFDRQNIDEQQEVKEKEQKKKHAMQETWVGLVLI